MSQAYAEVAGKLAPIGNPIYIDAPSMKAVRDNLSWIAAHSFSLEPILFVTRQQPEGDR